MHIDISRLPPEGETFSGNEDPSMLGLESETDLRPAGPVDYEVTAYETSGELVVKGRLATTMSLPTKSRFSW